VLSRGRNFIIVLICSSTYPSIKWDGTTTFPWENRKLLTINTFTAAVHSESSNQATSNNSLLFLGPVWLRIWFVGVSVVAPLLANTFNGGAAGLSNGANAKNFMLPQFMNNNGSNDFAAGTSFMSGVVGSSDFYEYGGFENGIRKSASSVGAPSASIISSASGGKRRGSVVALAAAAAAANKAAKQRPLETANGDYDDNDHSGNGRGSIANGRQSITGTRTQSTADDGVGRTSSVNNHNPFTTAAIKDTFMSTLTGAGITMSPSNATSNGKDGKEGSTWGKLSSMMKTSMAFK
jgi:hypothetical protein